LKEKNKHRVIIIGGGYAGVSFLHKLKREKNIELVLIDKSKQHLLQTHIHKYLSNHYTTEDITYDHEKYCDQNEIEFICDKVVSINYEENYIVSKRNSVLHYDYLIIATGGLSIFPKQIENVLKYTKDIKDITNLDYYRNKFSKMLEEKQKNQNIVVVGGGVSGLQIACEYAYTIRKNGLDKETIQVSIIEGMPTLLPGMDPFLIKKAEERCKELNIKVINNYFASKILEDKVVLSNKEEIAYDMLLFVIGANGNMITTDNEKVIINPRNQLVVDEYYRINPYNDVFAIGDVVQAKDVKTDNFQSPTAQSARMQAELTAKNILHDINNRNLVPNNVSNKGILIDLGGPNCAIGQLFNINISGKLALWTKKIIYLFHSNKLN